MDRKLALSILDDHVTNLNLKRHMLAVEAAMRAYAKHHGEDQDEWGYAGLLHDFDWEIHPTLEGHPQAGAPILRARGVPEKIVRCILSHADHTGVARESLMEHALYACDEITGLITAAALIRPSRSLHDLSVKSLRKKWSNPRFAANVDRSQIERAVAALELDLWDHAQRVLEAMCTISAELGLQGSPAPAS